MMMRFLVGMALALSLFPRSGAHAAGFEGMPYLEAARRYAEARTDYETAVRNEPSEERKTALHAEFMDRAYRLAIDSYLYEMNAITLVSPEFRSFKVEFVLDCPAIRMRGYGDLTPLPRSTCRWIQSEFEFNGVKKRAGRFVGLPWYDPEYGTYPAPRKEEVELSEKAFIWARVGGHARYFLRRDPREFWIAPLDPDSAFEDIVVYPTHRSYFLGIREFVGVAPSRTRDYSPIEPHYPEGFNRNLISSE